MYTVLLVSGYVSRVGKHCYILFDNEGLYFRKHRTEQVCHRQPQVNADVSGQPLRERGLKPSHTLIAKAIGPSMDRTMRKNVRMVSITKAAA